MSVRREILLVISKFPPEYSGPGVRIPRLYEALKEEGFPHNLRVLCNGIEKIHNEQYVHKGLHVRRVTAKWAHVIFSKLTMIRAKYKHAVIYQSEFIQTLFTLLLSQEYRRVDMLHVAGHSGGTAAALVWSKLKKRPVLMELVTANAPYRQKYFFVFKTPKIEHLKVIALTKDMHEKCLESGLDAPKIWCRPNPINEEKFCLPSLDEKEFYRNKVSSFSMEKIVLVSVAKMMPQKNQKLIIEALRHLPENYVALIGGPLIVDGPLYERDAAYVKEMEKLITDYGLVERIHWVKGFVDAEEYMKAGDTYMMPAWNEGFGTPMLEAMGCGLPVIGNQDEPAFREWIKNGENGHLCDIYNPKNWAKAAESLSEFSRVERTQISKIVHENSGQMRIYAHYEAIINELTAEKTA